MNISNEERRFLRREIINQCLHIRQEGRWVMSVKSMKFFVRYTETAYYGQELKVYSVQS